MVIKTYSSGGPAISAPNSPLCEALARAGRFTDATEELLPLFADPDGRGSRRWREMFGLERSLPRKRGAFIALEALRSSSDS